MSNQTADVSLALSRNWGMMVVVITCSVCRDRLWRHSVCLGIERKQGAGAHLCKPGCDVIWDHPSLQSNFWVKRNDMRKSNVCKVTRLTQSFTKVDKAKGSGRQKPKSHDNKKVSVNRLGLHNKQTRVYKTNCRTGEERSVFFFGHYSWRFSWDSAAE